MYLQTEHSVMYNEECAEVKFILIPDQKLQE
jgi:hypothetical protein